MLMLFTIDIHNTVELRTFKLLLHQSNFWGHIYANTKYSFIYKLN